MSVFLTDALSRTLLLMRDSLGADVTNAQLLSALTDTSVVLAADADAISTHSGQSAFVTAALLMARSGHRVYLMSPETTLIGDQPPLAGTRLVDGLLQVGRDLLPTIAFTAGPPAGRVDLVVRFGAANPQVEAGQTISMNAADWSATLGPGDNAKAWQADDWPFGGLAAAALAAGEAFKTSMRRLREHARAPAAFDVAHAPANPVCVELAPPCTPRVVSLPDTDLISGGALTNAALYALLRLPGATGRMRVFDHDDSALSNLNRNMLLVRSRLEIKKVDDLARFSGRLQITPVARRFDKALAASERLPSTVLVGVDDIPSRWLVQKLVPEWLGVGATAGFMAMSSFHTPDLPCAGCLHPIASEAEGPIPTAAFVSFWGGLLLSAQFLRHLAGEAIEQQQMVAFPLRAEGNYSHAILADRECPVDCEAARKRKSAA
ncbi:hypothetical protein [Brevundimonas aveniformis]|uniref:hypothetical protein n=1 Tax=Brevundimonas aveniformis TaxID=370977 RepID=UPI000414356A|nr:hypothetical protein [Brevundimonas aveniformis]